MTVIAWICTCDQLPEELPFDDALCPNCQQVEYGQELTERQCTDCLRWLPDLEYGDNPEEWALICEEDAALYEDHEPPDL